MSMMGMSGGSSSYQPGAAPKVPMRADASMNKQMMNQARRFAHRDSYAKALLGGSAPAPTKSYTAQLFNSGGGGI